MKQKGEWRTEERRFLAGGDELRAERSAGGHHRYVIARDGESHRLTSVGSIVRTLTATGYLQGAQDLARSLIDEGIGEQSRIDAALEALTASIADRTSERQDLGRLAHEEIENHLRYGPEETEVHPLEAAGADLADVLDGLQTWMEAARARPIRGDLEHLVWHSELQYAGRVDAVVADDEGSQRVVDFKVITSHAGLPTRRHQVAAFIQGGLLQLALKQMGRPVAGFEIVYLRVDGTHWCVKGQITEELGQGYVEGYRSLTRLRTVLRSKRYLEQFRAVANRPNYDWWLAGEEGEEGDLYDEISGRILEHERLGDLLDDDEL